MPKAKRSVRPAFAVQLSDNPCYNSHLPGLQCDRCRPAHMKAQTYTVNEPEVFVRKSTKKWLGRND